MGDVIVRLTVNKIDGTYEAKIIGHENGSTCGDGVDEDILEDLLNAEVPGFGKLAYAEDEGKTCEYFEEKNGKQRPHSYMEDFGNNEEEEEEEENNEIGLGYEV